MLSKNRKILTKSDSDDSGKDKMCNAMDNNTKKKELQTSKSNIKVYVPYTSFLLNLSILNLTK